MDKILKEHFFRVEQEQLFLDYTFVGPLIITSTSVDANYKIMYFEQPLSAWLATELLTYEV